MRQNQILTLLWNEENPVRWMQLELSLEKRGCVEASVEDPEANWNLA